MHILQIKGPKKKNKIIWWCYPDHIEHRHIWLHFSVINSLIMNPNHRWINYKKSLIFNVLGARSGCWDALNQEAQKNKTESLLWKYERGTRRRMLLWWKCNCSQGEMFSVRDNHSLKLAVSAACADTLSQFVTPNGIDDCLTKSHMTYMHYHPQGVTSDTFLSC